MRKGGTMNKGERRNKFLTQEVQGRMEATVRHLFGTVDMKLGGQLDVSAPGILKALSLAYQKGIADAFDTIDGRLLEPIKE